MQIGIVVSYFDFLTYPLVTLGVPLCLLLILQADKITYLQKIKNIISLSIAWVIGYLGMWAMKWMIGSIATHKNILWMLLNRFCFEQIPTMKAFISHVGVLLPLMLWILQNGPIYLLELQSLSA